MRTFKLNELITIKYGKNQSTVESNEGIYPIFGTSGIIGKATNFLYDKESILIGRKGSIENIYYVDFPFWTVDTLFYTIINEKLVLPKYLYYLLSKIDFTLYNEGTTVPSLRVETLNDLILTIHNPKIQQYIVDTIIHRLNFSLISLLLFPPLLYYHLTT